MLKKPLLVSILIIYCSAIYAFGGSGKDKDTNQKKETPPRNIILMVGDGMGLAQMSAAMLASRHELSVEQFSFIGLSKTSSADNDVTDSGAGATAFSIGHKTYNGAIGIDKDSLSRPSILEIASSKKYSTGIVVTCAITHATPASFYAHVPSRKFNEDIALDLVHSPVDIFVGGGRKFFTNRKDSLNLIDSLTSKGFTMIANPKDLQKAKGGKIGCFTADEDPPSIINGRDPDYLSNSVETVIKKLSDDKDGFFLVVEGSQIDWGGHDNDSAYVMSELMDFDKAINKALDFAKKDGNTLVIVTADHETGGMALPEGVNKSFKTQFSDEHHTASMVPVYAFGPGARDFAGIYENTEIFFKMLKLLRK